MPAGGAAGAGMFTAMAQGARARPPREHPPDCPGWPTLPQTLALEPSCTLPAQRSMHPGLAAAVPATRVIFLEGGNGETFSGHPLSAVKPAGLSNAMLTYLSMKDTIVKTAVGILC